MFDYAKWLVLMIIIYTQFWVEEHYLSIITPKQVKHGNTFRPKFEWLSGRVVLT